MIFGKFTVARQHDDQTRETADVITLQVSTKQVRYYSNADDFAINMDHTLKGNNDSESFVPMSYHRELFWKYHQYK
jgi:hypothetical protein